MATEHAVSIDSETIAAVHHRGGGDRWLFFCHGFLSDKTGSYETRCERALEEGYDAVRFDFRGSGDSDGVFADATLSSRIDDLRAVIEHFDPPSYALFGSSFGAKVAFHAAAESAEADAIIARSPVTDNRAFDSYRATVEAKEILRDDERAIDRRFFGDLDTYSFDNVVAELDIPVAIFHGADDESVPIDDSFEAAAALETDVLFEKYADEGHRFSASAEDRLRKRAFEWIGDIYAAAERTGG